MKQRFRNYIIILLVLILENLFLAQGQSEKTSKFPVLKGPYLGQKPPGVTPVLFAPGIISTTEHEHSRLEFSSDGREIFWAVLKVPFDRNIQHIWHIRQKNTVWTQPEILPFAMENRSGSPTLSVDGKYLFFTSRDPNSDANETPPRQLVWKVARKGDNWGALQIEDNLLPRIKGKVTMSFCFTDNGNLYFDLGGPRDDKLWNWEIWMREFSNGQYSKPKKLGSGINDGIINWTPFVSPDEQYLIFSSNRMENGDYGDHYICYRKDNGQWTEPLNMGKTINTSHQERFPVVSPDGKYLFFARNLPENYSEIFWVDAKIIKELKPKDLR